MATLKDLARHLDLSVTQVSRALNDHSDVSVATKERVREGAREIGYRPNLTARKLKSGRSGIVAMIVPGRSETVEIEILMETVMGLSAEFSRRGLQFVLHVLSEGDDRAEAHRKLVQNGSVDGVIVTDPQLDDPRIVVLQDSATPFIVHGRDRLDAAYPFVDVDHRAIGHDLAAALLRRGCRSLALIDGPADRPYASLRRAGAEAALAEAGVAPATLHVHPGPMTEARGRADGEYLRDKGMDGAIAGNMMLAAGLRAACPDLSLAAHDDALLRYAADRVPPPLIRTVAPLSDAWVPLCDGLAEAIAGGRPQTLLDIHLSE